MNTLEVCRNITRPAAGLRTPTRSWPRPFAYLSVMAERWRSNSLFGRLNLSTGRPSLAKAERAGDDVANRCAGRCEREALGSQYGHDLELGPEGARAFGCAKRAVGNRGSYACDRRIGRCCPDCSAAWHIGCEPPDSQGN